MTLYLGLLVSVAVIHYIPPALSLLDSPARSKLETGEGGGGDPVLQIAM